MEKTCILYIFDRIENGVQLAKSTAYLYHFTQKGTSTSQMEDHFFTGLEVQIPLKIQTPLKMPRFCRAVQALPLKNLNILNSQVYDNESIVINKR